MEHSHSPCSVPYLTRTVQPQSEPLTLAEAKLFLRIDNSEEDELVSDLIRVARHAAEHFLQRSLITQSWMLSFDDYAPAKVLLPRGPVQSVTSVTLVARDGGETVVSDTTYYLNAGKEALVFDVTPISHMVEIDYVTGYGEAADVPEDIKQGMLGHIADLYDNRAMHASLSDASKALYKPYKVIRL